MHCSSRELRHWLISRRGGLEWNECALDRNDMAHPWDLGTCWRRKDGDILDVALAPSFRRRSALVIRRRRDGLT